MKIKQNHTNNGISAHRHWIWSRRVKISLNITIDRNIACISNQVQSPLLSGQWQCEKKNTRQFICKNNRYCWEQKSTEESPFVNVITETERNGGMEKGNGFCERRPKWTKSATIARNPTDRQPHARQQCGEKKKRKESHSFPREFIERTIEPLRPVDKWLTDEHRSGFGDGEKTGWTWSKCCTGGGAEAKLCAGKRKGIMSTIGSRSRSSSKRH